MPSENQNDNCIASEIIQTALRILRLGPICDSCFGRQFAMLGTGMTNSERGRSIKTFMVMSADLRDPEESGEMLRALAPSCRQARLRLGLEDLAEPCWVCLGQMYPERLEELADRAVEALSGIECSRFLVGTFMSGLLAENEELLLADGCSRYAEPMKSEINREVGKLIASKSGKQPDLNNPEVVVHLHLSDGHIEIQIQPLYIYGRYRKLQRGFPQTRWPCRVCGGRGCERCGNTGRMYRESVDELIRGPIVEAADAEDTVFHGAGREDIDARMLGSGRPFVVEVVRPRRRDLDLNALRDKINKECSGKVEVSDLIFVDKSMVETVKNERFEKTYDMYYFMDETAAVTREMGIRGVLSGVIFDMRPELLDDVEPFIKKWRDDELIKPAVGPHAVYTCSEDTLLRAKEISERYDVKIHIHLSETRDEVDTFVNQWHMTPVEFLENLGFLSERVVAAHCVWLTPRDMRILAERRVNVAHCPISNLKLASGIAPVATLIEQGVNVCLGTDGASSNNNLDIFEEMKVASVVQKCAAGRSAILPADAVWRMATENAYRAFSLDIGIRPGALADLALINIKRPWFTPETSMLSHLVYSMPGEVCWTICNGRVLMRDGVIEGEDKILEEAQRCYERLISEG